MNKKRQWHALAQIYNKIHLVIMLVYIISIILLFSRYKIYGALYILAVWLVELTDYGKCPITDKENYFRRRAGEKIEKKGFVSTIFRRYLHFNMSFEIIDLLMDVLVVISFIIIVLKII